MKCEFSHTTSDQYQLVPDIIIVSHLYFIHFQSTIVVYCPTHKSTHSHTHTHTAIEHGTHLGSVSYNFIDMFHANEEPINIIEIEKDIFFPTKFPFAVARVLGCYQLNHSIHGIRLKREMTTTTTTANESTAATVFSWSSKLFYVTSITFSLRVYVSASTRLCVCVRALRVVYRERKNSISVCHLCSTCAPVSVVYTS